MNVNKSGNPKDLSFSPVTVVFITNIYYPFTYGLTTYVKKLTVFLERNGFQTRVIAYSHLFRNFEDRIKSNKLREIYKSSTIMLFIFYIQMVFLNYRLKGRKIIIHSQNSHFCAVAAVLAHTIFGYRCFHTFSTDLPDHIKVRSRYNKKMLSIKLFDELLVKMSRITFVSDALRKTFERKVQTKSAHLNLLTINSIDISRYHPNYEFNHIIKKYSLNHPIFLFIGYLVVGKGPDRFIEALAKLKNDGKKFSALIIGSGPLENKLKKMVVNYKLKNHVHMLGDIPNENIPPYHACADIFVLPSLAEGMPQVILEAMASQTAVISTKIAGIPEAMIDNIHGKLIKPDDPEDLYNAMKFLLKNDRYKNMGSKGRKHVRKNHSLEKNIRQFIELYTVE
jgi:glycosyltransferase involved in cell wall biosynthesis